MIHFERTGSGNPLVLIHGFCEDTTIWEPLMPFLQGIDVIRVDLPGFGESPTETPTSMETYAARVIEVLDACDLPSAYIVGHSLGGYVTLAIAELYPERVLGFGLFHSTAYPDSEDKKANRLKTIDFIGEYGMEPFSLTFVPALFHPGHLRAFEVQIKELKRKVKSCNVAGVQAALQAMHDRPDRRKVLEEARVPVLFIVGKHDAAVPLDSSLAQITLPEITSVLLLEHVGHIGMLEATVTCARALGNFVG